MTPVEYFIMVDRFATISLRESKYKFILPTREPRLFMEENVSRRQCDQIGQFIGLWATFQSLSNN